MEQPSSSEAPVTRAGRIAIQVETGITLHHGRRCTGAHGSGCSCRPNYQAQTWSRAARKVVRRSFPTLAKARAWRQEAQVDLRRGALTAPTALLVEEESEDAFATMSEEIEMPEPRSYPMFCQDQDDRHRWRICLATAEIMFRDPHMDTSAATRLAAESLFFSDTPT